MYIEPTDDTPRITALGVPSPYYPFFTFNEHVIKDGNWSKDHNKHQNVTGQLLGMHDLCSILFHILASPRR